MIKKYILKTFIFLLPVILLFILTEIYYKTDQGDLIRLGYLIDNGEYRHDIEDKFELFPNKYTELSDINLQKENTFTTLTIGDSFSNRIEIGYNNYLADHDNISVANVGQFVTDNPIQTLVSMVNSDVFDSINVKYIILESIERHIIYRIMNIDTMKTLSFKSFSKILKNKPQTKTSNDDLKLFSDKIFKFPLHNIQFCFTDNPLNSSTFKTKTNKELFTNKPNNLLFYEEDLEFVELNKDKEKIRKLNNTIHYIYKKLKEKDIQLIFLTCPDKYDFYYDFILNKKKYTKPGFFEEFAKLPKSYCYIDSKKILKQLPEDTKDIYYYDDTHWSPVAARVIADKIAEIINHSNVIPEE